MAYLTMATITHGHHSWALVLLALLEITVSLPFPCFTLTHAAFCLPSSLALNKPPR